MFLYTDTKAVDGEKTTSQDKSQPGRTQKDRGRSRTIREYHLLFIYPSTYVSKYQMYTSAGFKIGRISYEFIRMKIRHLLIVETLPRIYLEILHLDT